MECLRPTFSNWRSTVSSRRIMLCHHQGFFNLLTIILGFWISFLGVKSMAIEGPKFTDEPPAHVEFFSDQGLVLNCSTTGNPMPTIQWHCGTGTPCSTISGLRLLLDNSLVLLPFAPDTFRPDIHERTYRCVGVNSFGTLVKDVAVRALLPPDRIEARVPTVPALKDYPVVLPCEFPETFGEVTSWVRDDLYIVFKEGPTDKYYILPNGSLLIWQASTPDFYSKFQCRIRVKFGNRGEILSTPGKGNEANSAEMGRPIISSYFSPRHYFEEGQTVVLPCLALGSPKLRIQWYRRQVNVPGGQFLPLSSVFDYNSDESGAKIQIRQGVLIIPSVRREHAGIYSCNASNLLGSVGHQVELVVHSPIVVNLQPSVLTVELGNTAEFTCTCSDSTLDLQWIKDGVEVNYGRPRLSKQKLQLTRVSKEDQGVYQCVVKDKRGNVEQKSSELRLGDLKPVLLYTFIEQTVLPGTILSVRCKGTGWPLPSVTWSLDGFPLPVSERFSIDQFVVEDVVNSYINITGVVTSDAGEYTCTFRNVAGETGHSNRINVYGDLLIRPMQEVIAILGKPFRLKCPIGGWPIDKVTWSKNGIQLPSSVHQKVSTERALVLEIAVKQDEGNYKCTATRQAQAVEGTVKVSVVVLPAITPFQFGNAVAGGRVSVLCSLTTTDLKNISITWDKDGQSLTSLTYAHKQPFDVKPIDDFSSSLSMRELRPDLDGNYTCRVTSPAHAHIQATWTSVLSVKAPPRITKFNFEEVIVEGMKVQALCFSQGDLPLTFKWFRDSSPLLISDHSNNGFSITSFGTNSQILTIESVGVDMGGVISCEVSNRAGSAVHPALLMIKVPPKFSTEPKDVSASIGSTIKLRCDAEGRPRPRVKWLQEIHSTSHDTYRDVDSIIGVYNINGTLTFSQVTKDHAGHFVCQANNDVGPPLTKRIQVSVTAPPKIRIRATKEVAEIGQEVTLRCVVEGDQPIGVAWRLNGAELAPVQSSNDSSELRIKSVRLVDRGDYTCFAMNPFGHDFYVISLYVQELPQSPTNFRVLHHSSRSITLAWSIVAYVDAYVLEFIVKHKRTSEENWTIEKIGGDETSRIIRNLLPYTTYVFSISARNQIGMSQPSELLMVTTSEEEPSSPIHLTVEEVQIDGNALRVSWARPEFPNGYITHYTILYQQNSDANIVRSSEKYRNVPSSRSSIILRVEPATLYSICVRAVNSVGMGPNSTLIQIQTREGVPKWSPQEIKCEGLTSKSLQISWKPPRQPHNGLILGFRVNLDLIERPGQNIASSELESEVTGTSTVIQGLRGLSSYSVQVAAFTSEGIGPTSRAFLCSTKESLPVPPPDLKVVNQLGYVILAWSYNAHQNGTLRKFHIYVRTREEGQVLKKSVPANVRKYELRHLRVDQLFEACITSENAIGEGSPSRPVVFKMPEPDTKVSIPLTVLSYGQRLIVAWKTDVVLECQFTTTEPNPKVTWRMNDVILEDNKDDTLELRNVKGQDSGNYSCQVSTGLQLEQISHTLEVQVPPDPPILQARKMLLNVSTILNWSISASTTSPLLGYSLNYRPLNGEWEEVNLDKKRTNYEFRLGLTECFGKTFEVFVTAYNAIGTSLPSETIRVEVEGHFTFPPVTTLFNYNLTSITFNFSTLPLFQCENALLTVDFKATHENQWILGHVTNWSDSVTLSDLQGQQEYDFRLEVQSGQGTKIQEFQILISGHSSLGQQTLLGGVYGEAVVIIPLSITLVAISSGIIGSLVFCWRRRKEKEGRKNVSLRNAFSLHESGERDYTIIRESYVKGSDCASATDADDDIHPYATFNMKANHVAAQPQPAHDLYYNQVHHVLVPDDIEFSYNRYVRQNSREEHDCCVGLTSHCGPERPSRIVATGNDRRASLPRSRHRRGDTENRHKATSSHSSGVAPGTHAQSVKRRRRNEDTYSCPYEHAFINV